MNIKNIIKKTSFKIGIVLLLLITVVFFGFFKKEEVDQFTEVIRKNITQKVSITGQVIPLKNVDLQFQIQGRVNKIEVDAGDRVEKGDSLISLNDNELSLDVLSMLASKDITQANLTKILEGSSVEEIQVYESAMRKAEVEEQRYRIALENAEINLENVKKTADQSIESSYEDALNILSSAQMKIFNAYNVVDEIQRDYFLTNTQDGIVVKNKVERIETYLNQVTDYIDIAELNQVTDYIDIAETTQEDEDFDTAILKTKEFLELTAESLRVIREVTEEPTYRSSISSTDKTSIDNQRSYINTILSSVIDSQQGISLARINNTSNIDSAQASLDSSQEYFNLAVASLGYAKSQLDQIKAAPKQYDVDLYQAKLNQAEVSLSQSREQLLKTILISPCDGIISDIYVEEGEIAKTSNITTSLVCENVFQIEAEVPEFDIGKISLGDSVEISLDAFSEKDFSGVINKIYPTETIIQGVVYYKIKVLFNDFDGSIKSGMTVDLEVITQVKENILIIPQRLITKKNQQKTVKVLLDEGTRTVVVETGISNDLGEIEIISGLSEGDRIIK